MSKPNILQTMLTGLAFALAISTWACGGDSNTPVIQGCENVLDTSFPHTGDVSVVVPANCPFKLTGQLTVPFAATVTMPASTTFCCYYSVEVDDRNGAASTWNYTAAWTYSNNRDFIQISGTYVAGHGGFDATDHGFDVWHHELTVSGSYVHASSFLAYDRGTPGANVLGPSYGIAAYSAYNVSATTDDPLMVGPVTWAFYVDGTLQGTSSDGNYSLTAGDQGWVQQVDAVITDANGATHTGTTFVTACTNGQIQC